MAKYTKEQLDEMAEQAEVFLDEVDPADLNPVTVPDLNSITAALQGIEAGQNALVAAVLAARHNGRSWAEIAVPLGVSRQAAFDRFAKYETAA